MGTSSRLSLNLAAVYKPGGGGCSSHNGSPGCPPQAPPPWPGPAPVHPYGDGVNKPDTTSLGSARGWHLGLRGGTRGDETSLVSPQPQARGNLDRCKGSLGSQCSPEERSVKSLFKLPWKLRQEDEEFGACLEGS